MSKDSFPILHGRRITNTRQFRNALAAASADLAAGRISVKEANAINREARAILKMILAAVSGRASNIRQFKI